MPESSTHRNIFIIFAPGGGGNHLANMLSLSDPFTSRISNDSYDNLNLHTHQPGIKNMQPDFIRNNIETFKNQSNVFCGHWSEYNWLVNSEFIDFFPNREFLAIQIPQPSSSNVRAIRRLLNFDKTLNLSWIFNELSLIYRVDTLRLLCNEMQAHWIWVWPDHLFNDDITVLLDNLKEQGINLNFNIDQLQPLHTKWIDTIDRQINK